MERRAALTTDPTRTQWALYWTRLPPRWAAVLALAVFAPGSTGADEVVANLPHGSLNDPVESRTKSDLSLSEFIMPRTKLGDTRAASNQTRLDYRLKGPVANVAGYRIKLSASHVDYRFDGESDLIGGRPQADPLDDLYLVLARSELNAKLDERWRLSLGAGARARFEADADFADALKLGTYVGLGYVLPWDLLVGVGVRVSVDASGGSPNVSPIWRLRWKIVDSLELRVSGSSARLKYRVRPGLDVFLLARLQNPSYQLKDRGGEVGEARLSTRQYPIGLRVRWKPTDHWRLNFEGGALLKARLRVTNAENDEDHHSESTDVAPYLRFIVRYRF
ncbi:MAG: DUF6268 family outer membrane beta-barrel protein [Proteobacteria bacterium]|nr:DUF6268 family outer membrane beta-barrel protein [Pseudomonadota bacterium]